MVSPGNNTANTTAKDPCADYNGGKCMKWDNSTNAAVAVTKNGKDKGYCYQSNGTAVPKSKCFETQQDCCTTYGPKNDPCCNNAVGASILGAFAVGLVSML
jgi:hypothetical protein